MQRRIEQPADKSLRCCVKCRATKSVSEFYKASAGSANERTYGGVMMPCKECFRAVCRGKTRSPAQRARDAARNKRPEVAEANRRRSADWYSTEHGKQWMREHGAKKYAANRDDILRENRKKYREDEKVRERIASDVKRRRATPKGRVAHQISNWRRKLRMRNVEAPLTKQEWREILEYFDHRCAYCLEKLERPTVEHVIPLSRGGTHTANNVVPACQPCNSRKNDRPIFVMLAA